MNIFEELKNTHYHTTNFIIWMSVAMKNNEKLSVLTVE